MQVHVRINVSRFTSNFIIPHVNDVMLIPERKPNYRKLN